MLTLNDGRNELWQWDTGRKLTVDTDCSQVHFSNNVFGRSIDVDVVDGVAVIPDVLLQADNDLTAWAFVGTPENGYTKTSKVFKVNRKNKPADYVFTPPEQTSLEEIKEKIEHLESIQDPDAIKNAVDDYLANNPIKVEEKDPTVPEWAKQPTPPDVKIPDKLPNPNVLTFTGAVSGTYDGSAPVTLNIPDSGGNVDYVGVEPAYEDIPKVFFGGALQQTKDEKVVPFRYISKTDDFSGYAEIKAQGNSSMSYPKKNQTAKMFKDADCTEKMKVDFKGWGKQNKHVYKANWIDLTHSRNVVSARLWGDVVKSRPDYESLPELLRTSPNQGAVDGFPVKVYADGVYQGRYTLNIPKDAWMANMDKDLDTHCILCGEGYNSGCFRSVSTAEWSDEIHDSMPTTISNRWKEVITFVMNSTDEDFRANLGNYFDIPSLIDYHLYGLLSCGLDAYGKNQLYLTYDGQKWIASMYDMDSTWGLWWNGSGFVATDYDRSEYQDMKDGAGNLLYIRLEKLFHEELQARWAELRSGALSIENIINRFERFTDIVPAELVKEDYASTTGGGAFTNIPSRTTNNIQQIRGYAAARHAWCDTYVSALTGGGEEPDVPDTPDEPETVPCTGITLSATELTFTENVSQTLVAAVEPTNTTDAVVWSVSPAGIAVVRGGVVTAVANGVCTITATCGEQSATCAVVVNVKQVNILENVSWEAGGFNIATGAEADWDTCIRTGYFDVSAYAGETIAFASNDNDIRIAAFDDSGACLGGAAEGRTGKTYIIYKVPETAKTARIMVKKVSGATATLYSNALSGAETKIEKIYDENGQLVYIANHSTKLISVQPNTSSYGNLITSGRVWTSEMEYISDVANSSAGGQYDWPDEAGFVNVNFVTTNENTVFLSRSNTQIGYSQAVE